MKGFYGKLLRIDLAAKHYQTEPLPAEVLSKFLGGKGLGSYLLLQNVEGSCDPLSPENSLIFTVGPATDTEMMGASRYGIYSKSPLTGGYAESYGGGRVASAIKKTGYDAIILQGASDTPIFLEISDQGVKFHDASKLWGMCTYDAQDAVIDMVGLKDAQAVVIGPAGEKLVKFACVENNYWRSAGRTGMGAVMGSKNIKAVVFHGNARCDVANSQLLKQYVSKLRAACKDNPGVKNYQKYGTPVMVALLNTVGAFPTRYWSRGRLNGWEKISGDALLEQFQVKARACPRCALACGKLTTIKSGPRAGLQIEGPEYETIYSFGGLCCIEQLDDILYLNDLCDRLGMDTITCGNLVAFVMEAVERGKLKEGPRYGDVAGAAQLVQQIARREGLGSILAEGIIRASKEFGMEDVAVHVKGMEPAGYDPRVLKGMGLGYATSARGACHLRATFYKPELAGIIDPGTIEGKAKLYVEYENRLTIFNTLILCVFFRDLVLWENLQTLIKAITGREYSETELQQMGNDIITLTRLFNLKAGIGKEADVLPKRWHTEPIAEKGSVITEQEFNTMLKEYYTLRNWDEEGRPSD